MLLLLLLILGVVQANPRSNNNKGSGGVKDNEILLSADLNKDGKVSDGEEQELLRELHSNLDKNKDGEISDKELFGETTKPSEGKLSDIDGDNTLSLEELKTFWKSSSVQSWSTDQVQKWLDNIGMSKYKTVFLEKNVNGRVLPALALNEGRGLAEKMSILEADRPILVGHILRVVFGYEEPDNTSREIFFTLIICILGGVAFALFRRQQEHLNQLRQLEERLSLAQESAKNTEKYFQKQLEEKINLSQSMESQLKAIEEEKKQLKQVHRGTENTTKELQEQLDSEREKRKIIEAWLREKFFLESQSWLKKWTTLLRQIEMNRESLTKLEKNTFIFTRTGKALEQNRQMESLEADINNWKKSYASFLEIWEQLPKKASISIPELDEKLQALRNNK